MYFAVTYRETVPLEAPPSFRGTSIKYSYKVTIGTQRFHHPTKLLRVPFRVLVVPGKCKDPTNNKCKDPTKRDDNFDQACNYFRVPQKAAGWCGADSRK